MRIKEKTTTILLITIFILSSLVLVVPVGAQAPVGYEASLLEAADRLVQLQNTDGGFDWKYDGLGTSDANCLGITAMGILKAHELLDKAEYETVLAKAYSYAKVNEAYYAYPDVTFLIWLADVAETDASLLLAIETEVPTTTIQDIRDRALEVWNTRITLGRSGTDIEVLTVIERALDELDRRPGALGFWDLEAAVKAALALGNPVDANAIADVMYANLLLASPYYFDTAVTTETFYDLALSSAIGAFSELGVHLTTTRTMTDLLIANQYSAGYWDQGGDTTSDKESVQTTTYAIMALIAQGDTDALESALEGANWLVSTQTEIGGWYPGYVGATLENLEVNSEAAWAIYELIQTLDIQAIGTVYLDHGSDETIDLQTITIQQAIDVADSGDTITVAAGIYYENLVIDKDLSIISIYGAELTTIDALGADAGVQVDTVDSFGFEGFTVMNFKKTGVVAKNTLSVQIENNIITATDHSVAPNAIQVGHYDAGPDLTATTGTVKDNQISGCSWEGYDPLTETYEDDWTGSGILVIAPNSVLTISGNDVQGCDVGLDIEAGPETLITNNDVHDNSYGLVFWNAEPIVSDNNIFENDLSGVYRTIDGDLSGFLIATFNWWGTTDSGAIAAMISGDVLYDAWLPADFETCDSDTDGDGFSYYDEVMLGTDPEDPNDYPGAEIILTVVGSVSGSGNFDATDEFDLGAEVDYDITAGDTMMTVAYYDGAPEDESSFSGLGEYIDVHVDDPSILTSTTITLHYDEADVTAQGLVESELRMYYWTGSAWEQCSNTGVDTGLDEIWAILDWTTTPDLDYLSGGPFGPGSPSPVIVLSPDTGFATTITGDWFTVGNPITIKWGTTTMITFPTIVMVQFDGTFIAIVTALNSATGTYTISADDTNAPTAYATFTVPDMTGLTGPKGPEGPEGDRGSRGLTGSMGPTGPEGQQGEIGLQGETGPQGPAGNATTMAVQGEPGPQGETGSQGETGPAGIQGESGPQGEQGLPGDQGPIGLQGLTGATGPQGAPAPAAVSWLGMGTGVVGLIVALYVFYLKK